MRFRTAILSGLLVLLSGTLAAILLISSAILSRSAQKDVAEDLRRAGRLFEDLQTYRQSLLRSEARVIAEEPRLKAVAATQDLDTETAMGVAFELRRALQSDLLVLADGSGHILADTSDPAASGQDASANPLIASALKSGEDSTVWTDGAQALQVHAKRLTFGSTVAGVVVVGYKLDDRIAKTAYEQTAISVLVELDGRAIGVSPFDEDARYSRDDVVKAVSDVRTGEPAPKRIELQGSSHLALARAFPGYTGAAKLRFVMFQSLDRALAPGRSMMRAFLAIAAAAFAVAVVFAAALSRKLSLPLEQLGAFTRQIAAGTLEAQVSVSGMVETKTLAEAMNRMMVELSASRRQLAERERVAKELEIATKIQTALLPRHLEVEGLEIVAEMRPASEVGGDYYEVISLPGYCWIAIGDVAGHGLTAGLVMLMIQSALACVVRSAPSSTPGKVLAALNETLCDNIRDRMARDEHVTLTILRYDGAGAFTFAGAHEDMILCRSKTRRAELIRSPGTWIGILPDAVDPEQMERLTLEDADLLILYTDGITEATRFDGTLFGVDRLLQAVESVQNESVDHIRKHIMGEVSRWTTTFSDDVTLVVIRHRRSDVGVHRPSREAR
jgi:sigma-B regulation protein RsbU (phosphoserine phosphatase)